MSLRKSCPHPNELLTWPFITSFSQKRVIFRDSRSHGRVEVFPDVCSSSACNNVLPASVFFMFYKRHFENREGMGRVWFPVPLSVHSPSSETQGQIVGARESLNGRKNMARRKVKNGEKRCCQSRSYLLPDPLPPPRAVKRPRRFLILNFIKEAIINQQVPITRNNMQQGVQRTQHACNI